VGHGGRAIAGRFQQAHGTRLTDIARPDFRIVRDGLAGWGGRIRTSASPNRNSARLSARGGRIRTYASQLKFVVAASIANSLKSMSPGVAPPAVTLRSPTICTNFAVPWVTCARAPIDCLLSPGA